MSNYQVPQRDEDPNKKTVHIIGKAVVVAVTGFIARSIYEGSLNSPYKDHNQKKKKS